MSLLNPAPDNEPFFKGPSSRIAPTDPSSSSGSGAVPAPTGPQGHARSNSIQFLTGSPAGGADPSYNSRVFAGTGGRKRSGGAASDAPGGGPGTTATREDDATRRRGSDDRPLTGYAAEEPPASRKRPRTSDEQAFQYTTSPEPSHAQVLPSTSAAARMPPPPQPPTYGSNGHHSRSSQGGSSGSLTARSSHSPTIPLPSPGLHEGSPYPSPPIPGGPPATAAGAHPSTVVVGTPNARPPLQTPTGSPYDRRGSMAERPSSARAPAQPPATPGSLVPSQVPRPLATPEQLEPSIFGVPPLDEFTVEVGSWIWAWVEQIWSRGDGRLIEIEAKIGVLRDVRHHNGGGPGGVRERLKMPVAVETILTDASGIHFESNMTERQHKRYNQILNARVEESAHTAYPGSPIKYSHRYEVDEFHSDVPLATPGGGRRKVRVTRDQKSGKVVDNGSICKERVADMNIFSPKRAFDFRISINLEIPAQQPRTGPTHRRYKDRISYSHQLCNVDLTQVRTDNANEPPLHELEIEFQDAFELVKQGERHARGQPTTYHDMLQVFLNNIRMLIRNAPEPHI